MLIHLYTGKGINTGHCTYNKSVVLHYIVVCYHLTRLFSGHIFVSQFGGQAGAALTKARVLAESSRARQQNIQTSAHCYQTSGSRLMVHMWLRGELHVPTKCICFHVLGTRVDLLNSSLRLMKSGSGYAFSPSFFFLPPALHVRAYR